jgi:hypothetical protein
MERVIDYFLKLAPNAPITAPQQKNPFDNQGVLVGLRSVADSNRRKRFCRPLPSHSVNRPCTSYLPFGREDVPCDSGAKIINFALFLTIDPFHPVYFHILTPIRLHTGLFEKIT